MLSKEVDVIPESRVFWGDLQATQSFISVLIHLKQSCHSGMNE